jgi:hypothetical protein
MVCLRQSGMSRRGIRRGAATHGFGPKRRGSKHQEQQESIWCSRQAPPSKLPSSGPTHAAHGEYAGVAACPQKRNLPSCLERKFNSDMVSQDRSSFSARPGSKNAVTDLDFVACVTTIGMQPSLPVKGSEFPGISANRGAECARSSVRDRFHCCET